MYTNTQYIKFYVLALCNVLQLRENFYWNMYITNCIVCVLFTSVQQYHSRSAGFVNFSWKSTWYPSSRSSFPLPSPPTLPSHAFPYPLNCVSKMYKFFFGCGKFSSVSKVILDVDFPCSDTAIHNYKHSFVSSVNASSNAVIFHFLKVTCFFRI